MIVVDTNLIVYLVMGGARRELAVLVAHRDTEWAAPLLWRSEFRNVLAGQVARRAMSLSDAERAVSHAETLMLGREHNVASVDVLRLADRSGCTAYDCEFVALSKSLGVSLVTSDSQVLKAFGECAMSPTAFVEQA